MAMPNDTEFSGHLQRLRHCQTIGLHSIPSAILSTLQSQSPNLIESIQDDTYLYCTLWFESQKDKSRPILTSGLTTPTSTTLWNVSHMANQFYDLGNIISDVDNADEIVHIKVHIASSLPSSQIKQIQHRVRRNCRILEHDPVQTERNIASYATTLKDSIGQQEVNGDQYQSQSPDALSIGISDPSSHHYPQAPVECRPYSYTFHRCPKDCSYEALEVPFRVKSSYLSQALTATLPPSPLHAVASLQKQHQQQQPCRQFPYSLPSSQPFQEESEISQGSSPARPVAMEQPLDPCILSTTFSVRQLRPMHPYFMNILTQCPLNMQFVFMTHDRIFTILPDAFFVERILPLAYALRVNELKRILTMNVELFHHVIVSSMSIVSTTCSSSMSSSLLPTRVDTDAGQEHDAPTAAHPQPPLAQLEGHDCPTGQSYDDHDMGPTATPTSGTPSSLTPSQDPSSGDGLNHGRLSTAHVLPPSEIIFYMEMEQIIDNLVRDAYAVRPTHQVTAPPMATVLQTGPSGVSQGRHGNALPADAAQPLATPFSQGQVKGVPQTPIGGGSSLLKSHDLSISRSRSHRHSPASSGNASTISDHLKPISVGGGGMQGSSYQYNHSQPHSTDSTDLEPIIPTPPTRTPPVSGVQVPPLPTGGSDLYLVTPSSQIDGFSLIDRNDKYTGSKQPETKAGDQIPEQATQATPVSSSWDDARGGHPPQADDSSPFISLEVDIPSSPPMGSINSTRTAAPGASAGQTSSGLSRAKLFEYQNNRIYHTLTTPIAEDQEISSQHRSDATLGRGTSSLDVTIGRDVDQKGDVIPSRSVFNSFNPNNAMSTPAGALPKKFQKFFLQDSTAVANPSTVPGSGAAGVTSTPLSRPRIQQHSSLLQSPSLTLLRTSQTMSNPLLPVPLHMPASSTGGFLPKSTSISNSLLKSYTGGTNTLYSRYTDIFHQRSIIIAELQRIDPFWYDTYQRDVFQTIVQGSATSTPRLAATQTPMRISQTRKRQQQQRQRLLAQSIQQQITLFLLPHLIDPSVTMSVYDQPSISHPLFSSNQSSYPADTNYDDFPSTIIYDETASTADGINDTTRLVLETTPTDRFIPSHLNNTYYCQWTMEEHPAFNPLGLRGRYHRQGRIQAVLDVGTDVKLSTTILQHKLESQKLREDITKLTDDISSSVHHLAAPRLNTMLSTINYFKQFQQKPMEDIQNATQPHQYGRNSLYASFFGYFSSSPSTSIAHIPDDQRSLKYPLLRKPTVYQTLSSVDLGSYSQLPQTNDDDLNTTPNITAYQHLTEQRLHYVHMRQLYILRRQAMIKRNQVQEKLHRVMRRREMLKQQEQTFISASISLHKTVNLFHAQKQYYFNELNASLTTKTRQLNFRRSQLFAATHSMFSIISTPSEDCRQLLLGMYPYGGMPPSQQQQQAVAGQNQGRSQAYNALSPQYNDPQYTYENILRIYEKIPTKQQLRQQQLLQRFYEFCRVFGDKVYSINDVPMLLSKVILSEPAASTVSALNRSALIHGHTLKDASTDKDLDHNHTTHGITNHTQSMLISPLDSSFHFSSHRRSAYHIYQRSLLQQTSVGLSYVLLLLQLFSKYLTRDFRFHLFYNGSKSFLVDDALRSFPHLRDVRSGVVKGKQPQQQQTGSHQYNTSRQFDHAWITPLLGRQSSICAITSLSRSSLQAGLPTPSESDQFMALLDAIHYLNYNLLQLLAFTTPSLLMTPSPSYPSDHNGTRRSYEMSDSNASFSLVRVPPSPSALLASNSMPTSPSMVPIDRFLDESDHDGDTIRSYQNEYYGDDEIVDDDDDDMGFDRFQYNLHQFLSSPHHLPVIHNPNGIPLLRDSILYNGYHGVAQLYSRYHRRQYEEQVAQFKTNPVYMLENLLILFNQHSPL